jgi:hypothetical protein
MRPVVAIHHQLVSTGNKLQVVRVIELLGYVLTEGIPSTSRGDTPTASIVRV